MRLHQFFFHIGCVLGNRYKYILFELLMSIHLIGMCPLLFRPKSDNKHQSTENTGD